MSSFKDALTNQLAGCAAGDEILLRWAADPRTDEIWDCVRFGRPDAAPEPFICLVLKVWAIAWAVDIVEPVYRSALREKRGNLRTLLKDALKSRDDEEVVAILTDAVDLARSLAMPPECKAEQLCYQLTGLSRQGREVTRPRKSFMRLLSDCLAAEYKPRRLRHVVAVLTEIAFNVRDIDPEHVRTAWRPTTRKARKRNTEFPATAGK
jgi:hypothetical protein